MRTSNYACVPLLVVGLASISLDTSRAGEEPPSVNVQANGPGWITVTYSHSGTGGVWGYRIERQGGDSVNLHSPNGQWTDSHLQPATYYAYSVCAIYEDGTKACGGPFSARTLPAPGKPFDFDPPTIIDVAVTEKSIKVFWGQTGDYPTILARLTDPEGPYVDQRKIRNVPNGSQIFGGLRPGVRYRVVLKGYSKLGSTLPWSPPRFIWTATSPAHLPPPPPSKPTLTVKALDPKTVSLNFAVKTDACSCKFLIYRDGKQVAEVAPRTDLGGLKGGYTDAVELWERAHDYRVCFLGNSPPVKVCSVTVAGPPPSIAVQPKPPADIDVRKPINPGDLGIRKPPRGNVFR